MTDDWWARKLGTPAPAPQGFVRSSTPAEPRRPPVFVPRPEGGVQQVQEEEQGYPQPNGVRLPVDAQGKVHAGDAWQAWRGKDGVRELETVGGCPECGSPNYFSRAQGVLRGPPPAPHCYDCGYPLVQAGSGMGDLAGKQAPVAGKAPQAAGYDMAGKTFQIIGRVAS